MRQDSVGANAEVSEEGAHVTGRGPGVPKLEMARISLESGLPIAIPLEASSERLRRVLRGKLQDGASVFAV